MLPWWLEACMVKRQQKYIFVTGGVLSSLGKGIAAASIGALLKGRGFDVSPLKLDPYLNVDPGTMNPFQHGEVFVTDDGAETDLDLGHYERYLDQNLSRLNSKTAGQIYQTVLDKERRGDYLGKTVQVIPHVTDEIKAAIHDAAQGCDILICEIGGTVGDIESLPFLEAIRQLRTEEGSKNVIFIHVSYVPFIKSAHELKTKPTQHSVKELLGIGIQPDILLLRAESDISNSIKQKISLFCNVPAENVIACPDAKTVYEVPLLLHEQGLDEIISEHLNIWGHKPNLNPWKQLIKRFKEPEKSVKIGIVGKYVQLVESYKSINEAFVHAGIANNAQVQIEFIDAEEIKNISQVAEILKDVQGILVPGGFGVRGTEGMILAVQYAREHNLPFFGICLGMHIAAVEFARNVAKIKDATSQEFDAAAKDLVIHVMENQRSIQKKGGTMRLGQYACHLADASLAQKIYKQPIIFERHRHRLEFNNAYRERFNELGMAFSGLSPDARLVEIMELPKHSFFIGCQFHPELLSRPLNPHPLFKAFVEHALCHYRENGNP